MRILIFAILLLVSFSSHAVTLSFDCITDNSITNCGVGEANLSVTVSNSDPMIMVDPNQVLFTFNNNISDSGDDAVITQIYFDDLNGNDSDQVLDSIDSLIQDMTDVNMSTIFPGPSELPGGNGILDISEFSVGAIEPPPVNGIGFEEEFAILFNIAMGFTFQNILDQLANGGLLIGLHVQSFPLGDTGSESFVNNPVPLPAAFWLFGSSLIVIGAQFKRRNPKNS